MLCMFGAIVLLYSCVLVKDIILEIAILLFVMFVTDVRVMSS